MKKKKKKGSCGLAQHDFTIGIGMRTWAAPTSLDDNWVEQSAKQEMLWAKQCRAKRSAKQISIKEEQRDMRTDGTDRHWGSCQSADQGSEFRSEANGGRSPRIIKDALVGQDLERG